MGTFKARFFEPMLLLRTERLPEGTDWLYEVKLDGYRAIAFKTDRKVHLRSRNDNDFAVRYPSIVAALQPLPNETVVDGEIVALDVNGKPSFNTLQNHGSSKQPLLYYLFDVVILGGKDLTSEPLSKRRELLNNKILPALSEPIRQSRFLDAGLDSLIESVKLQGFEGLVAKNSNSKYEVGDRSGAWQKMRVNQGQELVIGGYTPSAKSFDALIIGYYEGDKLIYAARTRNGFAPASRAELFRKIKPLATDQCPFANLPETKSGRWGVGLTASKMVECRWLKPNLVGQFEFVEWTEGNHLRHTKFIALRTDKHPRDVHRDPLRKVVVGRKQADERN